MKLALTSLGMISSVGHDVISSCSAIRTGISRPKEILDITVINEEDESMPIIGHPVHGYTEGFNIVGLWMRLGRGILREVIRFGNLPGFTDSTFWQRTGWIGVTPYIQDDRFESDDSCNPELICQVYLVRLLESMGLKLISNAIDVVCTSHSGSIEAIKIASEWISSSRVDRVVVVAVDSYLDPMTLDWLSNQGRLKTPDNPVGLSPGEAGAGFMIESGGQAKQRSALVFGWVEEATVGDEPNHIFSGNVNSGLGLYNVVKQTLKRSSIQKPFLGDIITDLNGENWKAYELSNAQVRLAELIDPKCRFIFPAMSLGETGSASGSISIVIAAHSFSRKYSQTRNTLIVSSSDYGRVSSVIIISPGEYNG